MSKVKICGLSRTEDITAVNDALPDYIGFVFARSRRQVDGKTAAALRDRLDHRIKTVGVFVNGEIETVAGLYQSGAIDLAQLHGDEDDGYIATLKKVCGCPVVKAVGVGDSLPRFPGNADYLLFDTLSAERGGTGKAFDWRVLHAYNGPPYFLAGGLNAGNIPGALRSLTPYCIDVSSGAETGGVKDPDKILQIVSLVREV